MTADPIRKQWRLLGCANSLCDGYGERWPVALDEGLHEELCPICGQRGQVVRRPKKKEKAVA